MSSLGREEFTSLIVFSVIMFSMSFMLFKNENCIDSNESLHAQMPKLKTLSDWAELAS